MTAPANTSKVQYTVPLSEILQGKNRNEVVITARFIDDKQKIYTNNYFLTRYKDIDFPKATIRTTSTPTNGGFDATVESDVFARGVFLSIEGIDNFFSDNYFDLLPGEPVTIYVTTSLDKATFDKQLKNRKYCRCILKIKDKILKNNRHE